MTKRPQVLPEEPTKCVFDREAITLGAEHELGDFDRRITTVGCLLDLDDYTIVNSNGLAVDPNGVVYPFGGELNTPPFPTPAALGEFTKVLAQQLRPKPDVNYRSNLHIHVRVPGLAGDLVQLKKVQQYINAHAPSAFAFVEPIPTPRQDQFGTVEAFKGAQQRHKRRQRSHHTVLPATRYVKQMEARTLQEFYWAEVPKMPNGTPGWHLQPRAAINLRQLLQTDTVEFRHFPGTLDPLEVWAAAEWCASFLEGAFSDWSFQNVVRQWRRRFGGIAELANGDSFPKFPKYSHWRELRYRATVLDGTVPRDQVKANIARFLAEGVPHDA